MSQKFGNQRNAVGIFSLTVLLWLVFLSGCDPCHQLAERICQCRDSEEERRSCVSNLGLSQEHKYFKKAKDPEVCEQALKNCTCTQFNNNEDKECGMYRPSME